MIGALVVVAAVVAVVVLVSGGDDAKDKAATAPAWLKRQADVRTALDEIISGVDMSGVDFVEIDCPLQIDAVMKNAPDGTSAVGLIGQGPFNAVVASRKGPFRVIECSFQSDTDLAGLSLGVSPGAAKFEQEMRDYIPFIDLTFDEPTAYLGGKMFTYCGKPNASAGETVKPFCEADFVSDDVIVGVFASAGVATPEQLVEWLDLVMQDEAPSLPGA